MKITLTPIRILLIILCLSFRVAAQPVVAKQAVAVRSIDPADTDFSDLQALKQSIGDARIVMLGEQTHGEGSTCLAKIRLIRFLHEQMGFDVLAFESGLYDCARIWENTRNGGQFKQEVIGSLFFMWATSRQMYPLFDYIQQRAHRPDSLVVAGFESQHSGLKAQQELFPDFEKYLRARHALPEDSSWAAFKRISVATFASRDYRPSLAEQTKFFQQLDQLKATLVKLDTAATAHFSESAGFWYRITASIESQTKRYWQLVSGNEVSVRDEHMALNLIWLAEKAYPGKKIIVWAHNVHISKKTNTLQMSANGSVPPFFASYVPMGTTVHQHFGKAAFSIGFSGAEGRYMDYTNSKIVDVPAAAPASVEGQLAAAGFTNAWLDYRYGKGAVETPQIATFADFFPLSAKWPEVFDGLFFIKKVFPVDR
ncbi:erythromycin esterase family protein [Chitinophaga vietnamensis]|uniref:erythromycin esterase family protein n=1 Tax=Chitinophaga vietnamensis TaxID=2593957 RepID=UPI00137546AC|nr:erythromycin esterase family protein [Chitinophaga vietnamensis]